MLKRPYEVHRIGQIKIPEEINFTTTSLFLHQKYKIDRETKIIIIWVQGMPNSSSVSLP